jgi:hypothetical protein
MIGMKVFSFLKIIFFRRIIFNIFPIIIVNLLIFLFLKSIKNFYYGIILFSNFIPFINTGYLFVINYIYSIRKNKKYFFISFILMVISSCLAHFFAYFNWGFSSGHFYDPDWGTVLITKLGVSLNLLTLIIGSIIIQIYLINKYKKGNNNQTNGT